VLKKYDFLMYKKIMSMLYTFGILIIIRPVLSYISRIVAKLKKSSKKLLTISEIILR